MSIQSWKKEFYPVDASKCRKSILKALKHTLLKYTGTLKKNLKKHDIEKGKGSGRLFDCRGMSYGKLGFGEDTCALCNNPSDFPDCEKCVLYESGNGCLSENDGDWKSPYHVFTIDNDPMPMIRIVKKLIVKEEKNAKNAKPKNAKKEIS